MKISVWGDLSDTYLTLITQLGVDLLDFGSGTAFPGVQQQGYPDLDQLVKIRKRLRSHGLDINRVTLPDITDRFMKDLKSGGRELENARNALRVFGEAGIPIARQRFAGSTYDGLSVRYSGTHRGGYTARGESLGLAPETKACTTLEAVENWWAHFCAVYAELVPVAQEYGVKLAIHPSDTPHADTPLGGLGYHRVIDAFPSRNVGYLYCVGTRAEAGGSSLVLDEINNYGRKGRLFAVHFRNVRGSLASSRGFEEVLLDDGDLNMFKVILELRRVGFDGCLNPDHVPALEGDGSASGRGLAYSVGYIKGLLAAVAALS